VQSGEIKLEYCPTGVMLADYFTKPLQGAAFYKFRSEIMNNEDDGDPPPTDYDDDEDPRSVLGIETDYVATEKSTTEVWAPMQTKKRSNAVSAVDAEPHKWIACNKYNAIAE
jgi:hypothetical protein